MNALRKAKPEKERVTEPAGDDEHVKVKAPKPGVESESPLVPSDKTPGQSARHND